MHFWFGRIAVGARRVIKRLILVCARSSLVTVGARFHDQCFSALVQLEKTYYDSIISLSSSDSAFSPSVCRPM